MMDWRVELVDKMEDPDGTDLAAVDPQRVRQVGAALESFARLLKRAVESPDGLPALLSFTDDLLKDPETRRWAPRVLAFEMSCLRESAGGDSSPAAGAAAVEQEVSERIRAIHHSPEN